ncbi:class I SAM-dependent methyltransferase [Candidatus Dependentiae bacterium]|nr:class I SAM-dependent methyltransferase [Candidatus Dependentiae bacterium]
MNPAVSLLKLLYFPLIITSTTGRVDGPNPQRVLLSHLRNGDHAHVGDAESVHMVIKKALAINNQLQKLPAVDIGCGFGGTAEILTQKGFKTLGIDHDRSALTYAKNHHPSCSFADIDAIAADQDLRPNFFGLITLFNVAYAIKDKQTLLKALHTIAAPGSVLVVFDYTHRDTTQSHGLIDFAKQPMHPLISAVFAHTLEETGWQFVEQHDLTSYFITSYQALLAKIDEQRAHWETVSSPTVVATVEKTFSQILHLLQRDVLGGAVFYCVKKIAAPRAKL